MDRALRTVVRRAPDRFAECDWQGAQYDTGEALEIRRSGLERTAHEFRRKFGSLLERAAFRADVQRQFVHFTAGDTDTAFSNAYFSELLRAVGDYTVSSSIKPTMRGTGDIVGQAAFEFAAPLEFQGDVSLRSLLNALPINTTWVDIELSSELLRQQLCVSLPAAALVAARIELLPACFYRFTRAYFFGRVQVGECKATMALVLRNTESGAVIDQVLLEPCVIADLFSRQRASFQVDCESPDRMLHALQALVRDAKPAEILLAIGAA